MQKKKNHIKIKIITCCFCIARITVSTYARIKKIQFSLKTNGWVFLCLWDRQSFNLIMAGWLSAAHIGRSLISASSATLKGFSCVSHSPLVIHQLHSQLIIKYASPVSSEGQFCGLCGHVEWQCRLSVKSARTIMQIFSRFSSQIKVCYFCVFKVHIFRKIPHCSFKNAELITHFLRNPNLAHTVRLWTEGAQLLPSYRTKTFRHFKGSQTQIAIK